MQCSIGCLPQRNPVIGVANLRGKPGTPVDGTSGQYALCAHHYKEVLDGTWGNVILEGWEALPKELYDVNNGQ